MGGLFDQKLQAYTRLTANFTQPSVDATVVAAVDSSAWMPIGLTVFVEGGGFYEVMARPTDTTVTLKNLGAVGNATPAASVLRNKLLAPAGVAGSGGSSIVGTLNHEPFNDTSSGPSFSAVWKNLEDDAGDTEIDVGASVPGDVWILDVSLDYTPGTGAAGFSLRCAYTVDGGSVTVGAGNTSGQFAAAENVSAPFSFRAEVTGVTAAALVFFPQWESGPCDGSIPFNFGRLYFTVTRK